MLRGQVYGTKGGLLALLLCMTFLACRASFRYNGSDRFGEFKGYKVKYVKGASAVAGHGRESYVAIGLAYAVDSAALEMVVSRTRTLRE